MSSVLVCDVAVADPARGPGQPVGEELAEAGGPGPTGKSTMHRAAAEAASGARGVVLPPVPTVGRPGLRHVVPAAVREADLLLCQLAELRQGLVLPLARAAASLSSQSAWLACGYRNADDFCRESFQRSGRWLRNLARLHEAIQRLPGLGSAVSGADDGWPLGQMAALAIARVATPDDVQSWIARARAHSLEALRQEVTRVLLERGQVASDTPEEEPHVEKRVLLRLEVPPEVALAHEAVRDLHRAVAGRETALASFAEALFGEAVGSGWVGPEDHRPRFVPLDTPSAQEADTSSAQEAGKPRWDGKRAEPRGGTMAGDVTESLRHSGNNGGSGTSRDAALAWARSARGGTLAMRLALRVLAEFDKLEARQARLLRGLERASAARATTRRIRRLVAVLRRLVVLENRLEIALGELLLELHEAHAWRGLGYVGLEKSQALLRSLRDRPEAAPGPWIEAAARMTTKRWRQEERLLRCEVLQARAAVAQSQTRGIGGSPRGSPAGPERTVRFFPRPLLRQEPLDDAAWRESLRRVPGRTRQKVAGLGFGLVVRVGREGPLLPVALKLFLAPELAEDLSGCIEAARRELAAQPPLTPAEECRLRPSKRIANTFVERNQRVPEWVGYLALLECCADEWDVSERMPKRDPVVERDGCHCMAPGCTARARLHRHHLVYRSNGGGNEDSNRLLLCVAHHELGEHGGWARCRGTAPLDVVWRLGAVALGTWWQNEKRLKGPP